MEKFNPAPIQEPLPGIKRGDRIPLPESKETTQEGHSLYIIEGVTYICIALENYWENFSSFPEIQKKVLVGNKNLELEVFDGNELALYNENKWDSISKEFAVVLIPQDEVGNMERE